jgi:Concanavalin A-like lectin/glucanases superfamily/PEP-CTERM motif
MIRPGTKNTTMLPAVLGCAISLLGLLAPVRAAVTVQVQYHMGEAGSLGTSNILLDSSGNARHLQNQINGPSIPVIASGLAAPGSSAAQNYIGSSFQGYYGAAGTLAVDDNYGIEVWARTSAVQDPNLGSRNLFSAGGGNNGSAQLIMVNNRWAATLNGVAWVGGDPNAGGGVSIVTDEWVNLALVRDSGVSTFYVNGVALPGTATGAGSGPAVSVGDFHIGVAPGGQPNNYYTGDMDEMRVFTFAPGAFNAATDLNLVPEPSSALLLGAGLVALQRRRRSRA